MKGPLLLALAMLVLSFPNTARADVAPDPDSVDAHCSLAEQCENGTFCSYENNTDDPNVRATTEACELGAKDKGMTYRCTDGGGTVGQRLYCPKGESGSPTGGSPGCTRCAFGVPASEQPALPALLAFVALALVRRRRTNSA